jgi:hypothetical protein
MIKPCPDVTISVCPIRAHQPTMGNAITTSFPSASASVRHQSQGTACGNGHEPGSIR